MGGRIANGLRSLVPAAGWLRTYRGDQLTGDLIAGSVVAIMLVPQAMAYALLAGLPAQTGLYASIVPLVLYALLGTSRSLAVGPVAIVSLMTASALSDLGTDDPERLLAGALVLALLSGALLMVMGLLRAGVLVNFLSHPVISGFTSAAALVIGLSQLKGLLGLEIPRGGSFFETTSKIAASLGSANLVSTVIGAVAIGILLVCKGPLRKSFERTQLPMSLTSVITNSGPLLAVALGTFVAWLWQLDVAADVRTVGFIPPGLPPLGLPLFDPHLWMNLAPAAALIALVGFLESYSVAKSLAAKRREKIGADKELIALGASNVGAALSAGFPVTGGFSRSMVNFSAGAATPLASLITAIIVAFTLVFLAPLFHYLPKAVLAAVILVAVAGLLDWKTLSCAWQYNKADAASLIATFFTVLTLGAEAGIAAGIALSIALYLWRTSRPHAAVVGRVPGTEHFRNIKRHEVETDPRILLLRVDESLYFANTAYLEEMLLGQIADNPEVDHVVLICSAVSFVDTSALETLGRLIDGLADSNVTLHLAEVKGPVMDRFLRTEFIEHLRPGQVFLSAHAAVSELQAA